MFISILSAVILALIVSVLITVYSIEKEIKKKMKINDYIINAIDGVEKDFTSNNRYSLICVKGIKAVKKNNKVKIFSQSKLRGISILR